MRETKPETFARDLTLKAFWITEGKYGRHKRSFGEPRNERTLTKLLRRTFHRLIGVTHEGSSAESLMQMLTS